MKQCEDFAITFVCNSEGTSTRVGRSDQEDSSVRQPTGAIGSGGGPCNREV